MKKGGKGEGQRRVRLVGLELEHETHLRRVDDSRKRHVLAGVDTSKLGDGTAEEEETMSGQSSLQVEGKKGSRLLRNDKLV